MWSVRPDLVEPHLQRVARRCALNVDGTGLRIAARADELAVGIPTARVVVVVTMVSPLATVNSGSWLPMVA